jgi:hypothetical protein
MGWKRDGIRVVDPSSLGDAEPAIAASKSRDVV